MVNTHLEEYLDIKSFIKQYPQFKEGQLRWFVVRKNELGLSGAIKRLGRRLYIHVPSFIRWVESQSA
jgi:hypothetical protein